MDHGLELLYKEYHNLLTSYNSTATRLNSIAAAIKAYGGTASTTDELANVDYESAVAAVRESLYPTTGTWADKITYVLRHSEAALGTSDIFEKVRNLQSDLWGAGKAENGVNTIAATCSRLAKEGKLSVDDSSAVRKFFIK